MGSTPSTAKDEAEAKRFLAEMKQRWKAGERNLSEISNFADFSDEFRFEYQLFKFKRETEIYPKSSSAEWIGQRYIDLMNFVLIQDLHQKPERKLRAYLVYVRFLHKMQGYNSANNILIMLEWQPNGFWATYTRLKILLKDVTTFEPHRAEIEKVFAAFREHGITRRTAEKWRIQLETEKLLH